MVKVRKTLTSLYGNSKNLTEEAKIFGKFGHDCTLTNIADKYSFIVSKNASCFKRIKNYFLGLIVVSHESKFCTHHLRSFGALAKEQARQLTHYKGTIHPFSKARTYWSIIMMVVIFMHLVMIPFRYLFYDGDITIHLGNPYAYTDAVLNGFQCMNILINMITGYHDEPIQEVVLNLRKIFWRYLRTTFVIDLAAAVPSCWELFGIPNDKLIGYLLLSLVKFAMFYNFSVHTKVIANFYDVNYYNFMICSVLCYSLLFWHIFSCLFAFSLWNIRFWTDRPHPLFYEETMDVKRFPTKALPTILDNYAFALYTSTVLLTLAGYGSIPADEFELLLIIGSWYIATMFFIKILAMIVEINTGKRSSTHKYNEMEGQLMEYMRHKQLPTYMRQKILRYYEFKFQRRFFRENEILSTISEQLRQEMNLHACRKLVENVIFFRNLPLNLLVRIISCLKIEIFLVNDIIIRVNTPGSSMYFISTGTVAIYTKSGKEVCHLEDGAHFGEVALLIKDTFRIATVIAVEVSEIYRLDQKDFVKAINPYPDLLANIQHIAEERMEVSSMLDENNRRQNTKENLKF